MSFSIPSSLPFYLLCAALLAARLPYSQPLTIVALATPVVAVTSVITGAMDWVGVLLIALFALSAWISSKDMAARWVKVLCTLATAVLGLAIAMNVLPGFYSDAHENMGKGLVGFILICLLCPRISTLAQLQAGARIWLVPSVITVVLVFGIALSFGYIRFNSDPKPHLGSLLLYNLFMVCCAEEAFFRALLQGGLARTLSRWRGAQWITLVGVSAMFGLIHFSSKVDLKIAIVGVSIATMAGFGYGYVFMKSKRIESAIALHFAVNAILFVGFDSPLQKVIR